MGLKLYGATISPCTARVMTCLHEKGEDFELVPVDLLSGEHKQPSFLDKNPFGQVPVLEDGDLVLFESRAITSYICEKYKEAGNYVDLTRHQDMKQAAIVKMWVEVESQQFQPLISPIIYQYIVATLNGNSPDQTIIDTNLEKLGQLLDIYEAKLSNNSNKYNNNENCEGDGQNDNGVHNLKHYYLAGDFFSLADLHHLPYTYYLMKTPAASVINERPHVKAWWEDISSRPSFVKVSEGMTFGEQ